MVGSTVRPLFLKFFLLLFAFKCFLFFFFFWPWGTWNLSSLTRDQTRTACIGNTELNHWPAREALRPLFKESARLYLSVLCRSTALHDAASLPCQILSPRWQEAERDRAECSGWRTGGVQRCERAAQVRVAGGVPEPGSRCVRSLGSRAWAHPARGFWTAMSSGRFL